METNNEKWRIEENPFWGNRRRINIGPVDNPTTILALEDYTDNKETAMANFEMVITCVNGYSALQSENERLKEALQAVLSNFKIHARQSTDVNQLEIKVGMEIINEALNQSTVKEVGSNG